VKQPVDPIADPSDPRLRDFTSLRDAELRRATEEAEGLFVAEGGTTIRRAIAAGFEPRSVVASASHADALRDLPIPISVVDEAVLAATTGFPVHRGALASFARRPLPPVARLLRTARRVVVCEDLVDPTNLGLLLRSVAALGWDAALLTPRCADPLYRRAIKTSMGAVFTLPWTRIDWREGASLLRERGFVLAALTPAADATPIDDLAPVPRRLALAFGSEGPGLSRRWLDEADVRVRIPMRDGVDSLNVAAAAAIALHALGHAR
jgi:tRNA G18 (ribose-2'-O)-methylase SpoU